MGPPPKVSILVALLLVSVPLQAFAGADVGAEEAPYDGYPKEDSYHDGDHHEKPGHHKKKHHHPKFPEGPGGDNFHPDLTPEDPEPEPHCDPHQALPVCHEAYYYPCGCRDPCDSSFVKLLPCEYGKPVPRCGCIPQKLDPCNKPGSCTGQMWGDPYFKSFTGKIFQFQGVVGTWYDILSDGSGLHIDSKFEKVPGTKPNTTVAGELRVIWSGNVIRAKFVRVAGDPNTRYLDIYINKEKPIRASKTKVVKALSGNTKVVIGYYRSPPGYALIKMPYVDVEVTLRNPNRFSKKPTPGLNVYVTVKKLLKPKVTGILGVTYKPAAARSSGPVTASFS